MSFSRILKGQGVGAKASAVRNKLIRRVVVLLIVFTVSALFCVWSRVRIVQLGYEVSALQKQAKELTKKLNHLNLEVESLTSPGRLQRVATKMLGMYPPSDEEIVFVKKSDVN